MVLPAAWNRRAVQLGGGGMNGIIPNLTGDVVSDRGASPLQRGFATYGSDSGHQAAAAAGRGAGGGAADDWALNDEAIKNLGYMQMKKTHDAAMVLIERMYGERPRFNYYIGTSQGGREALTVAQRYPADYDGIVANVPIVSFSSLMLAPELIRIQEKPAANWVTPAKVNAIRGEFMRQCDELDGLADGIINNYMALPRHLRRDAGVAGPAIPGRRSAARTTSIRIPADTSASACLTDGQISTLEMVYTPLPVRDAARERRRDVRHVGAEHRSLGQRADRERALQRAGRRRRRRADALAPRRPRRHRLPDEGPRPPTRSTTSRAARSTRGARSSRSGSTRPIPICRRSRSAAAR